MGRQAQSQWEFGELFPAREPARRVFTVSELTGEVKRLLEAKLGDVWVSGEVSNFRQQSSGHCYFTLKDTGAQLSCVLFRGAAAQHREAIEDGRKLIVRGELTVYEPRGQYQLVARQVELQGVGALQLAFEKLKASLQAEGLFAPERKRPLPGMIRRLGLVTSPTGAALRDVLHVVQRRNPGLELVLAPCRVQGTGAAGEVVEAIRLLNDWAGGNAGRIRLDAILVTRGGGSLEDLWAFNEEVVARAIAASAVPVVSAVGHEIDFTISDFVADLRAATPSAAAELLTEGVFATRSFVADATRWLRDAVRNRLTEEGEGLTEWLRRIGRVHPRRQIDEQGQRLDDSRAGLGRAMRSGWRVRSTAWDALRGRWRGLRPGLELRRRRQGCEDLGRRLVRAGRNAFERLSRHMGQLEGTLRLLSPLNVLERGYSITKDEASGRIVRDAAELAAGQRLRTRVQHGEIRSTVERVDDQAL